jgi:hypothetical protein
MINIDYSDGKIRITTSNLSHVFNKEQLPLKIKIKKSVSKEVVWETELGDNMWAVYGENEINDVVIYDAKNSFVTQYYWDVMSHGSIFYKSLFLYCKSLINSGKKPNGLVIGTHDGEFGEWVPLIKNNLSNIVLVEGSEKQFNKLCTNYSDWTELTFIKDIITPKGGEVEFFEGGLGYTNTVVERVIRSWEKEEISSSLKKSTSINELINTHFFNQNKKLDWLHLDVEGLDVKLILQIEDEKIPNFIIFEDYNLDEFDRNNIDMWIEKKMFKKYSQDGICLITKM